QQAPDQKSSQGNTDLDALHSGRDSGLKHAAADVLRIKAVSGAALAVLDKCRQTGSNPFHPSRGPLAAILPLFPRRVQLPIPLGLNLLLMPGEHVLWRDVADSAVQTHVVVMLYVTLHQTPRIFERQRRPGPNALPFEGFVPTFDFAVRLRVIR